MLLRFRPKTPPVPPPPTERVKYGLYPVGDEVMMSKPTFEVIVHVLVNGSPEDRREVATTLRRMYDSSFVGVTG
jgi:hypothetical protein